MSLGETIRDIGVKACVIARNIKDGAVRVWNGIRTRLKSMWGSIRDLWNDEPDAPDALENARREAVSALVRDRIGEDPILILRDASPQDRKKILQVLADDICKVLNMPPIAIQSLDTEPGTSGYYDFANDSVVVGVNEVLRVPMDSDDAAELMDTLLHELYHRFQRYAIQNPRGMGVSQEQADLWEQNFENYINSTQSPRLYWIQPVEVTARCFAHAVIQNF
jgi:hypothetical protein